MMKGNTSPQSVNHRSRSTTRGGTSIRIRQITGKVTSSGYKKGGHYSKPDVSCKTQNNRRMISFF